MLVEHFGTQGQTLRWVGTAYFSCLLLLSPLQKVYMCTKHLLGYLFWQSRNNIVLSTIQLNSIYLHSDNSQQGMLFPLYSPLVAFTIPPRTKVFALLWSLVPNDATNSSKTSAAFSTSWCHRVKIYVSPYFKSVLILFHKNV